MSDAPSTSPAAPRAVFVSYSHDDAVAARRIAEALRSRGLEVWFDENELRGGDTWDAKIKQQIRDCALFLPVISQNTQRRREGYFRLEWHLAEERSRLIARGTPFLVPVAIDDVAERGALVPEVFLSVQWTRLRPLGYGGHARPEVEDPALPAFAEQVKALLAEDGVARVSRPVSPENTGQETRATTNAARRVPAAAWIGFAAIVAVAAFVALRPTQNAGAGTRPPPAGSPAAPAALEDKALVVMPFANLSDDRDGFADGVHEDIVTQLVGVRELRVVPRTTAVRYRDSKKSNREIAEELRVRYLMNGSVRRAGSKVRVTATLIKAPNDEHVWAKEYNRPVDDIFAIQSELAQEIAASLKATLSPEEKKRVETRPTRNLAAYDLFVKARGIQHGPILTYHNQLPHVQELLEQAVGIDPQFVTAWAELAAVRALRFHSGAAADQGQPAIRDAALKALEAAQRLAPDSVDVQKARGEFLYRCEGKFVEAAKVWEQIPPAHPHDPAGWYSMGIVCRKLGRWREAIENFEMVAKLDPADLRNLEDLRDTLVLCRRFPAAREKSRRLVALGPEGDLRFAFELARVSFLATGSSAEIEAFLAGLTPDQASSSLGTFYQRTWLILSGDKAGTIRIAKKEARGSRITDLRDEPLALSFAGELEPLRERVQAITTEIRAASEGHPAYASHWLNLATLEALLGNKAEASAAALRGTKALSEADDASWGTAYSLTRAIICAWTDDKETALRELQRLVGKPVGPNVNVMRRSLWYAPLRGDPRFEALINDPKNNAPLF